jgi:hypothetical protein
MQVRILPPEPLYRAQRGAKADSKPQKYMRTCSKCGEEKAEDAFAPSRDYWCRECVAEYNKKHYEENKENYKDRARKHERRYKGRNFRFVWLVLLRSCCVDCGETDERVLEFDHVKGEKKDSVVRLAENGYGISTIKAEMKKCEIVCRNCHKRRTMKRQGGWRQRKYTRE